MQDHGYLMYNCDYAVFILVRGFHGRSSPSEIRHGRCSKKLAFNTDFRENETISLESSVIFAVERKKIGGQRGGEDEGEANMTEGPIGPRRNTLCIARCA